MKGKFQIWKLATFLFGLLVISALAFFLGRESRIDPSSTSYGVSGSRAFATLLERSGFQVSRTDYLPREAQPDTLMIAFSERYYSVAERYGAGDRDEEQEQRPAIFDLAEKQLRSGGPMAIFFLPSEPGELPATTTQVVTGPAGQSDTWDLALNATSDGWLQWPKTFAVQAFFDPWKPAAGGDLVTLFTIKPEGSSGDLDHVDVELGNGKTKPTVAAQRMDMKSGLGSFIWSGSMALNENLDRAKNASFLVMLLKKMSASGIHKVLFVDGAFTGNDRPDLFTVLGPWSKAAWTQVLVLVLVIVWGVATRFGLPTITRQREMASRQLLDGIADTMYRGGQVSWALQDIINDADRKVRLRLGLAKTATASDRNSRISVDLSAAFFHAESRVNVASEAEAIELARRLDDAVNVWLLADRAKRS